MDEIVAMGFECIEMSHGLKVSLLPGIRKAFDSGRVKVSGLHNFCPSPVELMIDAPDAYEFTSHRPHDRERAMALTLKTIEFAAQFRACYVVLHLGSVPMRRMTSELEGLAEGGELNSRRFIRRKLKLVETRERLAGYIFPGRARRWGRSRRRRRRKGCRWRSRAGAITNRCPASGNWWP